MQEVAAQASTLQREIAFMIKWSPRRSPVEVIATQKAADASTQWTIHRPGKRECIWQESLDLANVGSAANPARRFSVPHSQTLSHRDRDAEDDFQARSHDQARWILGLDESDSGFAAFDRHYGQLRAT